MSDARKEIAEILKGDCNQVDIPAGKLAELIGPVRDQFKDLISLSNQPKADRVLVNVPELQEVLDALSILDARQPDVEPEPDVWDSSET